MSSTELWSEVVGTHTCGAGLNPTPPSLSRASPFSLFCIPRSDTFCSRFPLDKEFPHFRKCFGLGDKNELDQSWLS